MRWIVASASLLIALIAGMLVFRHAHINLMFSHLDVQIEQIGKPKPVNTEWLQARMRDAGKPEWIPADPSVQTLKVRLSLWNADSAGLGSQASEAILNEAELQLAQALAARPTWARNLAAKSGLIARQRPLDASELNAAIADLFQFAPFEWYAWRDVLPWALLRWEALTAENQALVAQHIIAAERHYRGWISEAITRYSNPISFCAHFPLESAPAICEEDTL